MDLSNHLAISLLAALPLLVTTTLFVLQWRKERRTLWLSIKFFACLISMGILFVGIMLQIPETSVIATLGIIFVALVAVLLGLSPLIITITAFTTGIHLIRKEGLRARNLLSIGAGICAMAYLLVWPLITPSKNPSESLLSWTISLIYSLISVTLALISLLLVLYVVASWLNLIPCVRKHYSHIIVLGAGLTNGRSVTPLLAKRVDAGIAAWYKNPGSTLIMSGGQGPDELVPEAQAMFEYALQKGVPAQAITQERNSKNTRENLVYSFGLIDDGRTNSNATSEQATAPADPSSQNVLVVSDNYHVYRALLLAKNMGLSCDGRGSRTRLYFYINAMVREFVAFIVTWKQSFIKTLTILWSLTLPWFVPLLITLIAKMCA